MEQVSLQTLPGSFWNEDDQGVVSGSQEMHGSAWRRVGLHALEALPAS